MTPREELETVYALLRECHEAIQEACCSEEGLDIDKGIPLLERIERLFPDLEPGP